MKKTLKIAALSTLFMGFFVSVLPAKDISTQISESTAKNRRIPCGGRRTRVK